MSTESIDEAMKRTLSLARSKPADASVRMQLFRLFVVTGQWDRALTQLDVAADLDSELAYSVLVYRGLVAGERFRGEVFAGKRTPVIVGEPAPWLAWLIDALRADQVGDGSGDKLRAQALEQAPAIGGSLNGQAFDWLADADSRIGPAFEAFVDGKYYWIPCEHLAAVDFEEPTDWLDMVWASAQITFSTGATKPAYVPARYSGSELINDDALRLSRQTTWQGTEVTGFHGLGQRVLTTDQQELGLLEIRSLVLTPPSDS